MNGPQGCLGVRIFLACYIPSRGLTDLAHAHITCHDVPAALYIHLTCEIDSRLARVAYRQPLIYNAEVARELLKQVYIAERLQPPTSFAAITDAYSVLWGRAKNPQYWRDLLKTGEWARFAVYAVEAYTIFKASPLPFSTFSPASIVLIVITNRLAR